MIESTAGFSSTWQVRGQLHKLDRQGLIMGIVNVTPDSFSDGGRYVESSEAVEHGLKLYAEGAGILDIGGESTRPGADPVSEEEEMRRILPVIQELRSRSGAWISADTMKSPVAKAAVLAGADIINDVNGLRSEAMLETVAAGDAAVVIMHMQGEPRTMQQKPFYQDVVAEVRAFFEERLETLAKAGIAPERVALDPGIGFGKTLEHNLTLLRNIQQLRVGDRPLLVGVSRKSMIAGVLGRNELAERDAPTIALTAWLRELGVEIIRVHEVKSNAQAMRMTEAILQS